MDRFIAPPKNHPRNAPIVLKSNMDRFIENIVEYQLMSAEF